MKNSAYKCKKPQTHVHEFLGSVKLASEPGEELHNHRFAGVSGQVIPIGGGNHVHEVIARTDFFDDHFHEIIVRTEPAIGVGDDKHVHFAKGQTTVVEEHFHDFVIAVLIQSPLTPRSNSIPGKIGKKLFSGRKKKR